MWVASHRIKDALRVKSHWRALRCVRVENHSEVLSSLLGTVAPEAVLRDAIGLDAHVDHLVLVEITRHAELRLHVASRLVWRPRPRIGAVQGLGKEICGKVRGVLWGLGARIFELFREKVTVREAATYGERHCLSEDG